MSEIFVFGSNLAGRHGMGAAKYALDHHGAIYGQSTGLQGYSYAIPTKDGKLQTLSLAEIQLYISEFIDFATRRPQYIFMVTQIGCGLAGYRVENIAPMFGGHPTNVRLPKPFLEVLGESLDIFSFEG